MIIVLELMRTIWAMEEDHDIPVAKVGGKNLYLWNRHQVPTARKMAYWYGKYTHCFILDLTSIERDRVYRTSMLKWNFKKLFSTFQVMDSYTALLTIEENDVGRKVVHFVQTKMSSIMEDSLAALRRNRRMAISLINETEVYSLLSVLLWYDCAEQFPLE